MTKFTPIQKLQDKIYQLEMSLSAMRDKNIDLKDKIKIKNEINRKFRNKSIYLEFEESINKLRIDNQALRKTISKRQESGCYECRGLKRLVKFSNISICLECIHKFEGQHWRSQ